MLTLIAMIVLAFAFALFSTQNTNAVNVNIGSLVLSNVPLYLVILIPLLLGLLAAYFIHIAYSLSLKLTISEQKDEVKKLKGENADLAKELHKLEIENTKLKTKKGKRIDEDSF